MVEETQTPTPNAQTKETTPAPTNYKELIVDLAAIGILAVASYMSITGKPMPEFFSAAFGSALAYLFIKNSPNTV